eukprot:8144388-Pyramimonas_sp.AAC.1
MPTSWGEEVEDEAVYAALDQLCAQGHGRNRTVLLFGDFNAVVGTPAPGDDPQVLGKHGVGARNDRGQLL